MALTRAQRIPFMWGIPLGGTGGSGNFVLSAAARREAYSFIVPRSGLSLDSVRFFCGTKNGTVVAGDAQCQLVADGTAGLPTGSVLETKTADSAPAASTWNQWSGWTTALTAGARYWFVMANLNGTPATNNFGWNHAAGSTVQGGCWGFQGGSLGWGWNKQESSDSGSTWGASNPDGSIMRIKYSDGSYDGTGLQTIGVITAANCVYDKREVGCVFTVPAGFNAYINQVAMIVWKNGTPAGSLRFRIYNGTTLLATTFGIPVGNMDTGSQLVSQYINGASPLISAGDTIRVVAGVSATGDTSTNRYNIQEYVVENDANAKSLKPFLGTASRTECTDNTAPSFTDTDTSYVPFMLGCDGATPFATSSGGGAGGGRIFTGM